MRATKVGSVFGLTGEKMDVEVFTVDRISDLPDGAWDVYEDDFTTPLGRFEVNAGEVVKHDQ